MEKEFIENLYNEKAKNDSNSEDLANTLNILSKTVFGDINRFVFELLQNADDSPNPDSQTELNVTFHLFDNYLLFSHNGKHFDENDVKGNVFCFNHLVSWLPLFERRFFFAKTPLQRI